MVNLAARNLEQKDLTRPKREEDSPSPGQPGAISPEMENKMFSNYSYVENTFQCVQEKLWRTSKNATFSVKSYKNNVLAWRMFMTSSMKAAIHLGPDFLENSEIYKNTKFENIVNAVQHHSKTKKKTFWRDSECEDPGFTTHPHGRDQHCSTTTWSSGRRQKFVSAQIQFCVWGKDRTESRSRPMQNGQDKLQKVLLVPLNSSGKVLRIFNILTILKEIQMDLERKNIELENIKDRISFMSMFNGIEWKKNHEHWISNANKVKNQSKRQVSTRALDFSGSRFGKEMVRWLTRWTMGPYSQQNGTAIQRNWSSYFHSHQCFESRNIEAKERQKYHSLQWRIHEHGTILSNN